MKLNIKSTLFFCLLLISSSPILCMQQGNASNSSSWYQGLAIGAAIGGTVTAVISYWWTSVERVRYRKTGEINVQLKDEIKNLKQEKEKIKNEADDLKKLNEHTKNEMIASSKKDEDRINGCHRLLEKNYKEIGGLKKLNGLLIMQLKEIKAKQERNAVPLTDKAAGIAMAAENNSRGSSQETL